MRLPTALAQLPPRIGADGWVALGSCVAVAALGLGLGGGVPLSLTGRTLWAPLLAAILGMVVCRLAGRPLGQGLGEWWPFLLMIALYMQLDPYTRLVHARPLDAELSALDVRLFGVEPCEWVARFRRPLVTELLALGYSAYFVLPLLAAAPVYIPTERRAGEAPRMRHRREFRHILTATVLTLGLGFVGYVLVPARGPRYFLPPGPPGAPPLHGLFGYYDWAIGVWNRMQAVRTDAFPSLHTATAAVAVAFGWRFRRRWRPLLPLIGPLAAALVASTVYLRLHYVVDVMAGLLLGLFGAWAGVRLCGRDPEPT